VVVTTESGTVRSDAVTSRNVLVKASRADALAALPAVYSSLGIEVKLNDSGSGQVGNRNFWKTGRLAGERISKFLGCGTMISGEAADNYRVTMSVVSQVTADSVGSNVETWLTAVAKDPSTSSGSVSCASKGTLETRINQLVAERFGR
jgi:hypothetical protein